MKHNMEHLQIGDIEIVEENDYTYCYRNAGACYGGIRQIIVDCRNIAEKNKIEHVRECAGEIYADQL